MLKEILPVYVLRILYLIFFFFLVLFQTEIPAIFTITISDRECENPILFSIPESKGSVDCAPHRRCWLIEYSCDNLFIDRRRLAASAG